MTSHWAGVIGALLPAVLITGCASAPTRPGWEETTRSWDALASGQGRIVVFCPVRVIPVGIAKEYLTVSLDDSVEFQLPELTFAYADVQAGDHSIAYAHDGVMNRMTGATGRLGFPLQEGEVAYVRIDWRGDPTLVDEPVALLSLERLRHQFRDTLPFNL